MTTPSALVIASLLSRNPALANVWTQIILAVLQLATVAFFATQFWLQRRDRRDDELRRQYFDLTRYLNELTDPDLLTCYAETIPRQVKALVPEFRGVKLDPSSEDKFAESVREFMSQSARFGHGNVATLMEGKERRLHVFLSLEALRRKASPSLRSLLQSAFLAQTDDERIRFLVMQAFLSSQPEIVQIVFNFGARHELVSWLEPQDKDEAITFSDSLKSFFRRESGAMNDRVTTLLTR